MKRPNRRTLIFAAITLLVIVVMIISFRDPPALVDSAQVIRGPFRITVEEEGRTRLPDRFEVSAPVAGYLNRVLLEPGDEVAQGDTLFTLNPAPADALDARTGAQARAALARAESALAAAESAVEVQRAQAELADRELVRVQRLVDQGHLSREALDRALAEARSASARLRTAQFQVDVARHERENAEAALTIAGGEVRSEPLKVTAPTEGVVLTRERQSAGRVQPGEPILTLGDLSSLQVEVDLLSPDAVRLSPGMRVELERWGGDEVLPGRVRRIEPAGFTHISALGVEEQRVWVIVDFDAQRERWKDLGDGYRVEARFILWEGDDVLQVPASALFREEKRWAVYVIEDGEAVRRTVTPGRRSGLLTEIQDGLEPGERVILHPGQDIEPGRRVEAR
ncbi:MULTISPECIES: efflux RND transporter periplasmic adaptor subunit [Marinimicrobium]|jgi:HlyD family secretion protein|uniref:HlyD family secretion protein n=1 Tax=Marinimicrobium koreense TaxID=306545 RepID=A0A3N1NX26_9GAMM|nr:MULTISPECIES: HlyD family efflux transporter periplasmic adaptor subunit [Marinimicrobium]ROQ20723.1 HlyD family secretion protein [Marinimicrobium koreense]|tara:strand:+ start:390 stop:1580 length:1191 start_codon:yes stop_codon:yes gene_type:complete